MRLTSAARFQRALCRRSGLRLLLAVTVCLGLSPVAEGRVVRPNYYQPGQTPRARFWEKVKSPHFEEVTRLVTDAQYLRNNIAYQYYDAHMMPTRHQVMREVMIRYERAYTLEPSNNVFLLEAAHAAYEAAAYDDAIRLYRLYRDKTTDNELLVVYNLAECELRARNFDNAIKLLEDGLGSTSVIGMERSHYFILLGYAYMAIDHLDDATEAFERAAALYPSQYGGGGFDYLAMGMLAVAYDRDEQLGRAHDAIEQLRTMDPTFIYLIMPQQMFGMNMPSQRMYVPFSPAADRHYWQALFDEAQGKLPEAAAGWRAYLDSHDPVYAARARDHLVAVEKQLAANLREKKKAKEAAAKKKPGAPAGAQPVQP